MSTEDHMWNLLQKGDYVMRNIEGMKFVAKVLEVYFKDKEMKIQYIDDNNVEDNVSFDEVERVTEESKHNDSANAGKSRKDTLQKPLIGLFEDDHEIRRNHKPTILIHDSAHAIEEEAIILNGAENKLAAGGGLRALRYLKK